MNCYKAMKKFKELSDSLQKNLSLKENTGDKKYDGITYRLERNLLEVKHSLQKMGDNIYEDVLELYRGRQDAAKLSDKLNKVKTSKEKKELKHQITTIDLRCEELKEKLEKIEYVKSIDI